MRVWSVVVVLLILAINESPARAEQTRTIPTDDGFEIGFSWFEGAKCETGDKKKIYFRVGDQNYAVEPARIGHARLKKIDVLRKGSTGKLEATISRNAGCANEPIELLTVEVAADVPSLPKWVVVAETAERPPGPSPVAKYIQHLGSQGQCKTVAKPRLVSCVGSRTENGNTSASSSLC